MPSKSYKNRGIPEPKYETGPNCDGCAYREFSQGYVAASGRSDSKYLLLGETPEHEEVKSGEPFIGGLGKVVNAGLVRAGVKRSECYVDNAVRCRPIKWKKCGFCKGVGCDKVTVQYGYEIECNKGQVPVINKYTRDFENATPTPGQIKECRKRYLTDTIKGFQGELIVGLGGVPLRAVSERNLAITDYIGTVFKRGDVIECTKCDGLGFVYPIVNRKCKSCKGRGVLNCECGGATKHRKSCELGHLPMPMCSTCLEKGIVPVQLGARRCEPCKGEGSYIKGDLNSNVSKLLNSEHLFLTNFDPGYIMKDATKKPLFFKTMERMVGLRDEPSDEFEIIKYPGYEQSFDFGSIISVDIENPFDGDPWTQQYTLSAVSPSVDKAVVFERGDPRFLDALRRAEIIVGQNYLLHDAWWLYRNTGIEPKKIWDTRFGGHLLNPDTPHNLGTLSVEYANPPLGYWKSEQNYKKDLGGVCGLDTIAAMRVRVGQIEKLRQEGMLHIMEDNVVPLCSVLFDIRKNGIRINEQLMQTEGEQLEKEILNLRKDLPFDGTENSKAVRDIIYDKYKLPEVNPKDGDFNTRKLTLEILEKNIIEGIVDAPSEALEFVRLILTLRSLSKLNSNFYKYPLRAERIHPALNPGGAATFRLSCSDPNVQQVPKSARGIFLPDRDGNLLTTVDLDQAEIVVFLWLSGQWDVYEKVLAGLDFHQATSELTGLDRKTAKIANFAMLYNEMPETTALRNKWEIEYANNVHKTYHERIPGVKKYQSRILDFAESEGYVDSPFGVRRYIPIPKNRIGHAVNQAVNAPIQATPAMATRTAMVRLAKTLPEPARIWMQVHDEIVIDHPAEMGETVRTKIVEAFQDLPVRHPLFNSAPSLRFNYTIKSGPSWGECK